MNTIEIQGKTYTAKVIRDGIYALVTQARAEAVDAKIATVTRKLGLNRPPIPKEADKMTPEDWAKYQEMVDKYLMTCDPSDPKLWDEYSKLWLEFCRVQLVEDVSDLSVDKLAENEMLDLQLFFVSILVRTRQKQLDGPKSSNGTEANGNSQSMSSVENLTPSS